MENRLCRFALGLALAIGIAVLGGGKFAQAQSWPAQDRQQYPDRDHRDQPNGQYGEHGGMRQGGDNVAHQTGIQDGMRDGMRDRTSGHSYRPTSDDNYKHATNGYQDGLGDKDQYKQAYREAYERGYQRGYNGNESYSRGDHDRDDLDRDDGRRDHDEDYRDRDHDR